MKLAIAILAAVLVIGGGVLGFTSCKHIDAGHVGVRVQSCSSTGSGIEPEPISVGYHWAGPCTQLVKFPTYQQTLILTKSPHEGSKTDDSITVTSSEGLPISVDVALSFVIDPQRAAHIYGKYRLDLDHIKTTYMRQTVREVLQETFAQSTAQQLYSDKRESSRAHASAVMTEKLGKDGFVVTQFTINETRIPVEVSNAIKAKVAMVQSAQQAEQEIKKAEAEGRIQVVQYEATARATKAQAEGAAFAAKAKAEAEAWANERLAKSISPALIEYLRAQRWDGKLPQVTSGALPMFNIAAAK